MRPATLIIGLLVALQCGCGDPQSAADADAEEWVVLETGKSCAKTAVACGPGNCAANVDNTCRTPVTCDLHMESICRAYTGEEGPATATSGEYTILSGDKQGLAATVVCDTGEVLVTIARTVTCF
jgi:hypothetical protein